MGNLLSAHTMRGAMLQASFEHTYEAIRNSEAEANRLASRLHDILTQIARGAVQGLLKKSASVSLEDVRQIVNLIHEWLDILDSDCMHCRLPELAREIYEADLSTWDIDTLSSFAEKYILNVCGFVSDDDSKWHVSDETLAHMVERVNKAELLTQQSVTVLAHQSVSQGASKVAASAAVGAMITNPELVQGAGAGATDGSTSPTQFTSQQRNARAPATVSNLGQVVWEE